MGFETKQDMFFYMLKETFDTQGISDDIMQSFVLSRVSNQGKDLVGDFNKLYDEFIRAYPSKEASTVGGKIIERKNTAVTFVQTIAEGEKQAITRKIYREMETTYPDLFFTAPKPPAAAVIPIERQPLALSKVFQDAQQELALMKVNSPAAVEELAEAQRAANDFDIANLTLDGPSNFAKPLSQEARLIQQQEKTVRFAATDLNESISRTVSNILNNSDEITPVIQAEQKRFLNAMISDLYEGTEDASKYALGELAMEGQGFLGTNVARSLITPRNVQRLREAQKVSMKNIL